MIRFEPLEKSVGELRDRFSGGVPFRHVVLEPFVKEPELARMLDQIDTLDKTKINKSRDYFFAQNKFEKSNFREIGPEARQLYEDLISERFRALVETVTGEAIFVDPNFHGGGLHIGGEQSFLDMHADFNYHPLHRDWFRNLNILLYLNRDWKAEYGGQLKLRHRDTGASTEIEPLCNRCVIMLTRDYTLHGFDPIRFPKGQLRYSIATYAYSRHDAPGRIRSTQWLPENAGYVKRTVGRYWPILVRVKNRFFGSGTARNQ